MIKRTLIGLAVAASYLSMSGIAHAQEAIPCQFFDDTDGVLCGLGSRTANAQNWVALGSVGFAIASSNGVAVGSNAWGLGDNSTVVGTGSQGWGFQSAALGFGASAMSSNSLALGANSSVTNSASGSIALGAGSFTNQSNVLSIGSFGNERRIVNVAGPIDLTDAANRGYVDGSIGDALITAQDFSNFAADQARTQAQNFASNLITGGATAANFASTTVGNGGLTLNNSGDIVLNGGGDITLNGGGRISLNGGGIINAGRITGVSAGIAGNDAVNVQQLNTVATNAQTAANNAQAAAQTFAQTAADNAQAAAQTFAQTAADNAQTAAQGFATNLVTDGTTNASVASMNVNGGGITNAGTISGVTAATTADQAVNFGQLQAVFTQLVQSGLCRIDGANVSCGVTNASNAVAVGGASVGNGANNAIAVGNGANAQSAGGIAMGLNATAVQANSVAIGAGARANSSVALGTGAQATGTNTTAVGDNANAAGQFAVAVGNNATATHDNSVAIGNGSQTSAANTVSVGAAGAERRITNVATGTATTDAVNLAQLNTAIAGIAPQISGARDYTNQQIALTNARTDTLVRTAREHASRGIAASSALPTAVPSQVGKTAFNIGAGHYDGETAVGLSIAHSFTRNLLLSGSIAQVSGGDSVSRVGIGFEF